MAQKRPNKCPHLPTGEPGRLANKVRKLSSAENILHDLVMTILGFEKPHIC